jgi:hypothetical protein
MGKRAPALQRFFKNQVQICCHYDYSKILTLFQFIWFSLRIRQKFIIREVCINLSKKLWFFKHSLLTQNPVYDYVENLSMIRLTGLAGSPLQKHGWVMQPLQACKIKITENINDLHNQNNFKNWFISLTLNSSLIFYK